MPKVPHENKRLEEIIKHCVKDIMDRQGGLTEEGCDWLVTHALKFALANASKATEAEYNCPPLCPKCQVCHRGDCETEPANESLEQGAERCANHIFDELTYGLNMKNQREAVIRSISIALEVYGREVLQEAKDDIQGLTARLRVSDKLLDIHRKDLADAQRERDEFINETAPVLIKFEQDLAAAKSAEQAAMRDKERLDWLELNHLSTVYTREEQSQRMRICGDFGMFYGDTLRTAIDAAITNSK